MATAAMLRTIFFMTTFLGESSRRVRTERPYGDGLEIPLQKRVKSTFAGLFSIYVAPALQNRASPGARVAAGPGNRHLAGLVIRSRTRRRAL
jgi:hypothetical protein